MIKKRQPKFIRNLIVFVLFTLAMSNFIYPNQAQAEIIFDEQTDILATSVEQIEEAVAPEKEVTIENFSINLDKATIAKGYTVTAFNDSLKLSLVPGILSQSTRVDCETIGEEMPIPWNLKRISPIYQFEFRNKEAYDNHKPFYIQFSYDKKSNNYKRVFFYDKNYGTWRELPTRDFPEEGFVRSLIHLPYARIAVLESEDAMTFGKASWYAYKGGDFAASPDFPKGSRLRVYNIDNGKYVDVEVNDYGPDRSLHPDRAIDLDKIAFSKISSIGAGIIDVNIEPLYVAPDSNGKVLGISATGATTEPVIKAKSSLVMDEKTGEIIFEKNTKEVLPIASLSKLVAVKVFLDQNISMDKEIIYLKQDEEYNFKYCEPWESAKLSLKEGDIVNMENLVYSALVGSANNAVETLARASGFSRDVFIKKMNDFALELGAKNTYFVEPTGLSPENVSTAGEYAIIVKEVFKNPLMEKISITAKYEFYTKNTKEYHRLINTNYFIRSDFFASTNNLKITGSKTGYLNEALYCLVTRATGSNGEKVLVINMGSADKEENFSEVKELILYGVSKIK